MIWSVLLKPRFVLRLLWPFDYSRAPSPLLCIWHCVSCGLCLVSCRTKLWFSSFFFFIFLLPVWSFHDSETRAAAYQKCVLWCKGEAAVHAPRCDMEVASQLKSSAGPCKAQGNKPAAASSTVGPWFRAILSFNDVLIYKFCAFFPGWLIVKE